MSNKIAHEKDTRKPLKLPPILNAAAAEDLVDRIRACKALGGKVLLDATEVDLLGYSCLQILLAAFKNGTAALLTNPSSAFVDTFTECGIALPETVAPHNNAAAQGEIPAGASAHPACDLLPAELEAGAKALENGSCKRVLTIDDSKTMRDMLMLTLVDAGFDVLQAVDGQHGLDVLGREKVDVIITDINMPRMDGYEVIRRLRDKPEFKETPILVLTTESELAKKNLAREVGATGWMVKPFDPDRLVATVRKVTN